MKKYAVMGFPIAHSKSPEIHKLFAEQTGVDLSYEKIEVKPEDFTQAIDDFLEQGGNGLNITVPLKSLAYQQMDGLDQNAKTAKAVNTISIDHDGKLTGYNTDGIGLVRDLTQNHGIHLKGRSILILGAGGAVQGVINRILECQPNNITIANRTLDKANAICADYADNPIQAIGLDDIQNQYDIIINGTSASLNNTIPSIPDTCLIENGTVYDMVYQDQTTPFMQWGLQHGAKHAIDGFGMLIEQAAEAFYIWHDKRPDTKAVLKTLRPTT